MGDHFGKCRFCAGNGMRMDPVLLTKQTCGACDGSGFSGAAVDYDKDLYGADREREHAEFIRSVESETRRRW